MLQDDKKSVSYNTLGDYFTEDDNNENSNYDTKRYNIGSSGSQNITNSPAAVFLNQQKQHLNELQAEEERKNRQLQNDVGFLGLKF